MSYRRKSYTYEDGDAIFPIPFDYIEQDDILVFINDEQTTDFVIENTQVKLNNKPIETPAIIKIVSVTDIDKAAVEWENVSSLDEDNLILSDNQIRYAVQELYDNTEQFKVDINNTLSEVNEAARLISTTIEAVDNAITTTQEQAIIATEQANLAAQQSELVASTANKALEDIDTLRTNTLNELDTIVEDSVETVSGLANAITNNAQNIINRLGINLFDTKVSDHVLEGDEALGWALQGTYIYKEGVTGSRYGYPDFYAECVSQKDNATATETTLGDSTITMYINGNGHQFYDIADKDVVDIFYNSMGVAWFYGIDTENERIFLPRNNFFDQMTGDVSQVGKFIEAGLPEIGVLSNVTGSSGSLTNVQQSTCTSVAGVTTPNATDYIISNNSSKLLLQNPNKYVYGNSDTVQPNAIKKLLYICVGNTTVQSSVTNITEITTSENDTLPLFHNFYSQEDMTTTGAYVNASLGTFLDGNIYKTAYNELVKKLGTDNVKSITDDYTDYDFVVNQDDMTFRLPLLNGEESIISGKTENLTLLATGSDYIAPANGWFYIMKIGKSGEKLELVNKTNNIDLVERSRATSEGISLTMEAKRNDSVLCSYTASGDLVDFKFIYAKGDGNLYYKVANAVENLEILDVAKVMKEAVLRSSLVEADSHFSGVPMPSDKYIDLTAGASDTQYTAPANGWFVADSYVSGNYITLENKTIGGMRAMSLKVSNTDMVCYLPVSKGDVVRLGYGGNWTPNSWQTKPFRFYYAKGEV